ncbi:MAG: trigger factor [Lachnospiraceae bacterium]|nr:trigger factor [Lachnospiraceae bacterium]
MSVQVTNLEEKNMVQLTIEVSAEELEKALQSAYNRQKKDFSIPGFRKGKVPRYMIEKMYGPAVFYEDAVNDLIPGAYSDAVEESGQDVVSRPTIDVVQIEKGKPFIFTADVAVRPEVALGKYAGVTVTKVDTAATEEEVMAQIDKERENNARIVSVEGRAIESGDTAVIDYEGFVDGVAFEGGKDENHSLEIGSGSFIPGFEDQLIGKNVGDEVEVNVTFPEEYHAPDLAGKDAVFQVKIHEVKTKELPELDDEFAQDVSEFDTVDEYKASVKTKVEERKAGDAKRAQQEEALQKIVEKSKMDIPAAMIDTQCENMINQFAQQMAQQGLSMEQYFQFSGSTMDQLKEQVRPDAESRIKNELVLDAIAKAENIEITDEDIDAELESMAAMYQMEAEQLKGYMGEEEKENMKLDLASRKALEFVTENMKPRAKAKTKAEKEEKEAEKEAE